MRGNGKSAATVAVGSMKAFQFIEGKPDMPRGQQEEDKENQAISEGSISVVAGADAVQQPPSPSQHFPSTPATRLPLSDLLGNFDEPADAESNPCLSPEEHISWRTLRSPKSSAAKKTPAVGKKRARSSSPPSTSQRNTASNDPLNLRDLKNTLKIPRIDPAAEMWNRYAVNTGRERPSGINPTILADLAYPSSPFVAEDQSSNVSGLRRWQSCGTEWPSSKAKRRKVNHATAISEEVDGLFADSGRASRPPAKNMESKIPSLLLRIQESLAKPREPLEPTGPSSSSPLPDHTGGVSEKTTDTPSPTRGAKPLTGRRRELFQADSEAVKVANKTSSSSSFGSDDFGDGIFNLPEATVPTVDGTGSHSRKVQEVSTLQAPSSLKKGDAPPNAPCAELEDDDFGDDLDISVDDLETVATICDTRTRTSLGKHTSVEAPRTDHIGGLQDVEIQLPKAASPEDEFGEDDFDDDCFVAAEVAATQCARNAAVDMSGSTSSKSIIQRYLVQNVCHGTYIAPNGLESPEKILLVEDEKTKLNKVITLRQSWVETRCTKGSYVHVIGKFDRGGQCVIDDTHNILILHPDHLISALVVADSFTCMRKSVLQDRIKAASEASPPMIYGTILHEVFQEAMQANRWDTAWLRSTIEAIVARHIEDLYQLKLTVVEAIDHLVSKMPELQAWAKLFVHNTPQADAVVKDRNGKSVKMCINKLLDVEEHVWSPMYGLKGNIDATVQVTMEDEEGERTLTVPFEIKTGKNSTNASHRAQTALYTLLVSDRYDVSVAYGILYYLETSEISRIPAIRHELLHMIMQRNELACFVRERLSLPPMIKSSHQCNRCYAKTSCFIYHKLGEEGDGETSGMREKFNQVTRHLNSAHQQFFKKWDDLLTKEESEIMKFKRELWTMLSDHREKHGRCFANVVLEPTSVSEDIDGSKINRFRYTFRKEKENGVFSFNESHMSVGEPIVVSDENGHYALALGYIIQLGQRHVTVAVDRRLHNARKRQEGFNAMTNQTFDGIMEVDHGTPSESVRSAVDHTPVVYRLDKDEFSNGLANVRNNLIQIMTNDAFHARELRSLIIEGAAPRFREMPTAYELSGPLSQMNTNGDQRQAIERIMSAEDYALVLGMPGTGKTTTIAHIIRALVAKGKSVLLTSYTHTAVDNILLKLRDAEFEILRLGAVAKIHPEVREFAQLAAEPRESIEELEKLYQGPQVVATTCLGINHQIFNERTFDYCIVDEASQITLPVCLGPIRMAKVFVLVGDHYQLPPLVQNRQAQEGGLDVSLFKLLSEMHPSSVSALRHQYRMNEDIMSISNELIYSGRLVCGSNEVAKKRLQIPNYDALVQIHNSRKCGSQASPSCWLYKVLHNSSAPVIFLNTDTVLPNSLERANGARIVNAFEATLMTQLVQAMLLVGLEPATIGLITLYRSQLALIKSLLATALTTAQAELLEAHTTDRFQGRDKDIVVISCVRSNERDVVGELLKDWRRVNVAVTRAKKKLIIIGSKGTLSRGDELLARLVKLCEEKAWMVDLPISAGDEDEHSWPSITIAASNLSPSSGVNHKNSPVQENKGRVPPQRPPNVPKGGTQKPFKVPAKVGRVTAGAVLGASSGNISTKRPIMADILNDMIGEML